VRTVPNQFVPIRFVPIRFVRERRYQMHMVASWHLSYGAWTLRMPGDHWHTARMVEDIIGVLSEDLEVTGNRQGHGTAHADGIFDQGRLMIQTPVSAGFLRLAKVDRWT
jgi:hypothetical protein